MSERVVLIGEAPGVPGPPLEGVIGQRLAEYAGLTFDEYLKRTERRNVFDGPVDKWDLEHAIAHAVDVWPQLIGRRTILLGSRVASAFGVKHIGLFGWLVENDGGRTTSVAVIPHPSGRNRWWNEAEHRAQARRFLEATFGTEERE